MKKYSLNEIRKLFLEFFQSKGHTVLPAFSLVPQNDKSLLLINSGMAPLKNYFTGLETPPSKRVTTCQTCIRTPDIENVGKTARHGTFFEMLGNFSFGDYFKKEAISWAWEFFTEVLNIDPSILYVTVYQDDDEAYEIWNREIGVDASHIVRMGKEDNFWEIGTGPCGPCSEIHVDRGPAYGCGRDDCGVECECDRFIEIWNLVFTQFDKDEHGEYHPLAHPNIDTGMGLERISAFMQGVDNIFEVDTIRYVLDEVCRIAGVRYGEDAKKDVSIRVITDHLRSVVFMASDGIMPGNAGREYVMRRLLRRAVRHGRLLGINEPFMQRAAKKVIEISCGAYEALREKEAFILKVIGAEEEKFSETINQGLSILESMIQTLVQSGKKTLSGNEAFKLYDTFGFPLELTQEILADQGLSLDEEGFSNAMQKQKMTAKHARENQDIEGWKDELLELIASIAPTEFVGYDALETTGEIVAILQNGELIDTLKPGAEAGLIAPATPFYATGGGQMGDMGSILYNDSVFHVKRCEKAGDKIVHYGVLENGVLQKGKARFVVDRENRLSTCRNHTATHLLQKALKMVLGDHVNQAGSYVDASRLRFDFSHFEKLSEKQIAEVEEIVNNQILQATDVDIFYASLKEAKQMGAMALFGEKYGSRVRVVKVGDFSCELCGGTHIDNIGKLGLFKIVSQSAVSAGVRRIEALTGKASVDYVRVHDTFLRETAEILKATPETLVNKTKDLLQTNKALEKALREAKTVNQSDALDHVLRDALQINGVHVVLSAFSDVDMAQARQYADALKDKLGSVAGLLLLQSAQNTLLLTFASKDVAKKGFHCGDFIKTLGTSFGFSGGGRDTMAQAGMKQSVAKQEIFEKAKEILKKMLV